MRKIYLAILFCLSISVGYAQIGGPDTVCRGANISYMDSSTSDSYIWVPDTVNTTPNTVAGSQIVDLKSYGAPYNIAIAYDNATSNYWALVTIRSGKLLRLDFGGNPYSTPTITDLGSLGVLTDSTHGVDIAHDGTNWYAFVTNNNKLIRLDFNSSLANTPTATSMKFVSNLSYAYQITVKKYGNEWIAFAVNRNSNTITRFDFGTTLTSTPAAISFGDGSSLQRPTAFSLYKESGNWYMIVTNIGGGGPGGGGGISRFDFGTNLKLNTPAGFYMGGFGNKLSQPRGISLFADCDKVIGLTFNSGNSKVALIDFKSSIASSSGVIGVTDMGRLGLSNNVDAQCFYPFLYTDRISLMAPSIGDSVLYMYDNVYSVPTGSQVSYSQATYPRVLNMGGVNNITLHADQGSARGPQAYCKQTYVINTISIAVVQTSKDTLFASGTSCSSYEWKLNGVVIPTATGRYYVPTQTGVYTCTGARSGCSSTSNYYFEVTGVGSTGYNKALMVYPNPATDILNIEVKGLQQDKKLNITCYNAMGIVVRTETMETSYGNGKVSINLANMPRGVYQVRVQAEGEANMLRQIVLE